MACGAVAAGAMAAAAVAFPRVGGSARVVRRVAVPSSVGVNAIRRGRGRGYGGRGVTRCSVTNGPAGSVDDGVPPEPAPVPVRGGRPPKQAKATARSPGGRELIAELDPGVNAALITDNRMGLSICRKFDGADWAVYQSPSRYWDQLLALGGSVTANRIFPPSAVLALWSGAVAFASKYYPALNTLSSAQPYLQIIGGAVSLLLVFRTNTAYGRFCLANDSFAEVTGACRNLSRKMATWCPVEERAHNARLIAAFPWALKHRGQGIEGSDTAAARLRGVLDPQQLAALDLQGNVAAQLLCELTHSLDVLNEAGVELIYQLLMDNDLSSLQKELARTDRIIGTPTPLSYTRHISRSIMLWLIALPFVLTAQFNNDAVSTMLEVVPATLLVCWLLLGIDDIGMQIEQPYTVMALQDFCQETEDEVLDMLGASEWRPRDKGQVAEAARRRAVEVRGVASSARASPSSPPPPPPPPPASAA
eukprot:CAMPEP_0197594574 /NCGR_PEP_ID=MMETSP1326-20131121/20869_1 /TAXON_ID=1155430 /ORGANISM="Genus nov. species nov., Strain RCC2288" /LENGTH=476 /DNA_ID=CAMNT_0043160787 /DNA_START=97 /DNA_END=1524 /DNA_ORIENTATION=+